MILNNTEIQKLINNLGIVHAEDEGIRGHSYDCHLAKEIILEKENKHYNIATEQDFHLVPGDHIRAWTKEYFNMPLNLVGMTFGLQRHIQVGLNIQSGFIAAGYKGSLCLTITNYTNRSFVLKKGMPICQVVFHTVEPEKSSLTRLTK